MHMKRTFAAIIGIAIFLVVLLSQLAASGAESGFPSARIQSLDGESLRIEPDPEVRYTVLEFWALWCAPCIESLPELDEVFQGLQDKPLRFYLVNCDNSRSRAKVRSYVRSHNIESKVVLDPTQNLVRYYNINSWPHLIVIDSEGRVVDRKTGYMPGDELLLEDKLLELLDK
jgi:thiol-disulfide isomerase/thioredoxin